MFPPFAGDEIYEKFEWFQHEAYRKFDRVDVQLSRSLNLLTGYKEAFSHWYLPSTERESEQIPDALSRGGWVRY